MAIACVMDILQGFRIVHAIIEQMSRNTVAGGADFLEGAFCTGSIAYFLDIGQELAPTIMGGTVKYAAEARTSQAPDG
jgi:hypothetical protein